jgi:hypothetical protein
MTIHVCYWRTDKTEARDGSHVSWLFPRRFASFKKFREKILVGLDSFFDVSENKCGCADEKLFWISLRIEKPFSKLPCLSSRANTKVVRAEINSSPYECKVAAWLSAL